MFCGLLFLSALFFALAFFVGVPTIAVTPRKFALSFVSPKKKRNRCWILSLNPGLLQNVAISFVLSLIHAICCHSHPFPSAPRLFIRVGFDRQWDPLHLWLALAFLKVRRTDARPSWERGGMIHNQRMSSILGTLTL